MSATLDIVATQLFEAACCALGGDGAATQAHIARALVLLQDNPGRAPEARQDVSGALSAWRAQRVASHIESNLSGTIRVRDLAHLVGLSNSYFCHAFKRRYGLTVHVYLTCRRIEMAQQLMLSTTDSLSEIALSCGMSDQAHFTRAFRRVVGETPNRWRQSRRAALAGGIIRESVVRGGRDDLPDQARL
jgi:AraC family transcriptional regulator